MVQEERVQEHVRTRTYEFKKKTQEFNYQLPFVSHLFSLLKTRVSLHTAKKKSKVSMATAAAVVFFPEGQKSRNYRLQRPACVEPEKVLPFPGVVGRLTKAKSVIAFSRLTPKYKQLHKSCSLGLCLIDHHRWSARRWMKVKFWNFCAPNLGEI